MLRRPTANSRLRGGDGEMAGAQLDQVAARRQARQRGLQVRAFGAFGSQFAHQLLEIGAGVRQSRDVFEQGRVRHTSDSTGNGRRPASVDPDRIRFRIDNRRRTGYHLDYSPD